MFFLPLPFDKTLQTIEDVENSKNMALPDPELYIVVSSKPSKQKVLWQSMINVAPVRVAVQKLKHIN